jgi:hypothetical protein
MTRIPDAPMAGGELSPHGKVLSSADPRRRPLVQYVVTKVGPAAFVVHRGVLGAKPSHALIVGAPIRVGTAETLASARGLIPHGCRNLGRRRDDAVDVVEVWV